MQWLNGLLSGTFHLGFQLTVGHSILSSMGVFQVSVVDLYLLSSSDKDEHDSEMEASVLGLQSHWDSNYADELANFHEHGDAGEIWSETFLWNIS